MKSERAKQNKKESVSSFTCFCALFTSSSDSSSAKCVLCVSEFCIRRNQQKLSVKRADKMLWIASQQKMMMGLSLHCSCVWFVFACRNEICFLGCLFGLVLCWIFNLLLFLFRVFSMGTSKTRLFEQPNLFVRRGKYILRIKRKILLKPEKCRRRAFSEEKRKQTRGSRGRLIVCQGLEKKREREH